VIPFEEVRDTISAEFRDGEARGRMNDLITELDDIVYDIDDSLAAAAEEAGVEVQTSPSFSRASGGGVASYPQLREAAFSDPVLVQKLNSTSIEADGKYFYIRVNQHVPSRTLTLEEVTPRVESLIKQRLSAEKAALRGSELLDKLTGGADMTALAEENELTVTDEKSLQRIDRVLPFEAVEAIFAAAKPAEGATTFDGVELANGDYMVFALSSVEAGDPLDETQADNFSSALANIELAAYISSLRDKASVVIKSDQLQTN